MQKRRDQGDQGLCFNCDEKFSHGHRYKSPRLLLLEGFEGDSEADYLKFRSTLFLAGILRTHYEYWHALAPRVCGF